MEPRSWFETLDNGDTILHYGDDVPNVVGTGVQWLYADDISSTFTFPNSTSIDVTNICNTIREFADASDLPTKEQQEISSLSWEQMMSGIKNEN